MRATLFTAIVVLCFAGASPSAFQARPTADSGQSGSVEARALKIIVIAGEDAVNIIQQKTAVSPIVEVRDRNDLPVAGALVSFAIGGGHNAAFGGGLQTLTVTTNAAGRAAAIGLTPTSSGAVQINVTAAFQGQTATATITQANFTTAAQAAQAAKVPGSGGTSGATGTAGATTGTAAGAAAGTAGGLSGAGVGAIVGGAAAGGLLALKAASGGSDSGSDPAPGGSGNPPPSQPPTAACRFTAAPTSFNARSQGDSMFVAVTVEPDGCQPRTWSATSNASFITINPATTFPSTGTGRFELLVMQNIAGSARTGTVTAADQTVSVTQTARCSFTASPRVLNFPAGGGQAVVNVSAEPQGCDESSWRVTNLPSFITVSATGGTGTGSITATAQPNLNPLLRTDVVGVAGELVQILQAGSASACVAQERSGGDIAETRTIDLGRSSGTFLFSYETSVDTPDRMLVSYQGSPLFDTGCVALGSARAQPLTYAGTATTVTIQVMPNCSGGSRSSWFFKVSCP